MSDYMRKKSDIQRHSLDYYTFMFNYLLGYSPVRALKFSADFI